MGSLLISIYTGRGLEYQKGQVGIRFPEDVINGEQLEELEEAYGSDGNVREDSDKDDREETEGFPGITLWRQSKGKDISLYEEVEWEEGHRQEEGETKRIQVQVIELWGDVEQIYPQCLMSGAAISKEDEAGCMLSKEAAFDLFGAVGVLGKKVRYEGKIYQVRGILDLEEEVFLREDEQTACSFLEIQEEPGEGTERLRQILSSAGISLEDGAVLEWDVLCWILEMLRALALWILLCGGIRRMNQIILSDHTFSKWRPGPSAICTAQYCLRLTALLVLFLLWKENWCLSQDYIPAKWSDFGFFGTLFREQRENYMRYLDLGDIWKDRELWKAARRTFLWMMVSVVSGCEWIRRRNKYRTNV